jgi:hypothetical protein
VGVVARVRSDDVAHALEALRGRSTNRGAEGRSSRGAV